jgi:hypothetical protein
MTYARGVLGEEAALGDDIETGEQPKSFVRDIGHDVAAAFDRPELEDEHGPERVAGWDHARPREASGLDEFFEPKGDEAWDEEEQSAAGSFETARSERELAHIGDRFDGRAEDARALLVEATRQGSEPFDFEDLANSSGTQADAAALEYVADFIDGVISLAQLDDGFSGGRLLGLGARAGLGRDEERGAPFSAEAVTHDLE